MDEQGLNIRVSADISDAVNEFGSLAKALKQAQADQLKSWNALDRAIGSNTQQLSEYEKGYEAATARVKQLQAAIAQIDAGKNIKATSDEVKKIAPALQQANTQMRLFGLSATQSRVAIVDMARVFSGSGFTARSLGAQVSLLGPAGAAAALGIYALFEILNKTSDAEKKAQEDAKKLKELLLNLKTGTQVSGEAAYGEEGNIDKVRALAAAVEDGNRSYAERLRALNELKTINKSYFGDLTLESSSMKTLAERVQDYNNALVTQAIIKAQTEEIGSLSKKLFEQVQLLDKLKTARDQANAAAKANPYVDNQAGGLGDVGQNQAAAQAANDVVRTTQAYEKQRDAVLDIRTAIAEYNGELNKNIGIQLQQRPLQTDTAPLKTLESVASVLEKVNSIYADLQKKNTKPLFQLNQESGASLPGGQESPLVKAIDAEIAAASEKMKEAAGNPKLVDAYRQYLVALQAKLASIKNPNLTATFLPFAADPSEIDKETSKYESVIEKAIGGEKGLKLKVPLDLSETIKGEGFSKANTQALLKNYSEDVLNGLPPLRWNAKIQLALDKAKLQADFQKDLIETLNKVIKDSASSGLANIGKAIGSSLASGKNPLQAAGAAILGTVGNLVEQMGEALIKYGVEMELFRDIIGSGLSLSPAVAIAAGVAMVAIGEAVKKSVKVPAFADGGIVTGPTYGLIGEAGPEAIFPLSKMNDFVRQLPGQQNSEASTGEFVLRGQDLVLATNRATKNLNLVGKKPS